MKIARLLIAAALAAGLAGCWLVELGANSAGLGSPSKRVQAKDPPVTLFASDGTSCRVPEARFREIEVGDYITCVWGGGRSSSRALPPWPAPSRLTPLPAHCAAVRPVPWCP